MFRKVGVHHCSCFLYLNRSNASFSVDKYFFKVECMVLMRSLGSCKVRNFSRWTRRWHQVCLPGKEQARSSPLQSRVRTGITSNMNYTHFESLQEQLSASLLEKARRLFSPCITVSMTPAHSSGATA